MTKSAVFVSEFFAMAYTLQPIGLPFFEKTQNDKLSFKGFRHCVLAKSYQTKPKFKPFAPLKTTSPQIQALNKFKPPNKLHTKSLST